MTFVSLVTTVLSVATASATTAAATCASAISHPGAAGLSPEQLITYAEMMGVHLPAGNDVGVEGPSRFQIGPSAQDLSTRSTVPSLWRPDQGQSSRDGSTSINTLLSATHAGDDRRSVHVGDDTSVPGTILTASSGSLPDGRLDKAELQAAITRLCEEVLSMMKAHYEELRQDLETVIIRDGEIRLRNDEISLDDFLAKGPAVTTQFLARMQVIASALEQYQGLEGSDTDWSTRMKRATIAFRAGIIPLQAALRDPITQRSDKQYGLSVVHERLNNLPKIHFQFVGK